MKKIDEIRNMHLNNCEGEHRNEFNCPYTATYFEYKFTPDKKVNRAPHYVWFVFYSGYTLTPYKMYSENDY